MLLDDVEKAISTMRQIKGLGVSFSIDDFGTGYSSLQYLKRLPLDQIKIDQSFVRDITTDSSDQAIVRTIVAMAQSLQLSTIAEGVETADQKTMLKACGCEDFQGYLLGDRRPRLLPQQHHPSQSFECHRPAEREVHARARPQRR